MIGLRRGHEGPDESPERTSRPRLADDAHGPGAGPREAGEMGARQALASAHDGLHEWTGAGRGRRVEDDDVDVAHRASLAMATRTTEVERRMAMTRRTRAYVGIGANLGDAAATTAASIHALGALPGARLRGVSRLYATRPVGVVDQPEFLNAVVALDVPSGPDAAAGATALLIALKGIERAFGRQVRGRWGPRELDLDLLVFGRARLAIDRPPAGRSVDADADPSKATRLLEVPHPEARTRLFVLAPLADLVPGLEPPGWGERVATARRRQAEREGPDAVRPVASWEPSSGRWRFDPG